MTKASPDNEWYDGPKVTGPAKFALGGLWLWVIAALAAGVLTGALAGFMGALASDIESLFHPRAGLEWRGLATESSAILFFTLLGGGIGLIIGFPVALIFGPLGYWAVRDLGGIIRQIALLSIGILAGILAIYIANLFTNPDFSIFLPVFEYIVGAILGLCGALIFGGFKNALAKKVKT